MGRKARTDIVIENGKKYYLTCKCGKKKDSYKTSYCNECCREYYMRYAGCKTEIVLKTKLVTRKPAEEKDYSVFTLVKRKKTFYDKQLVDFVNRIERRRGWATLHEIFVELITLFNFYGSQQVIDLLPVDAQLEYMWRIVKERKRMIDMNIKKKSRSKKELK
jgi:hypothetical protein